MKKTTTLVMAALSLPTSLFGASITLTDSNVLDGGAGSINILPQNASAGTFVIDVVVSDVVDMVGADFRIRSLDNDAAFKLAAPRTYHNNPANGNPWEPPITSDTFFFNSTNAPLDPVNGANAGAISSDPFGGFTGTTTIASFTVQYTDLTQVAQFEKNHHNFRRVFVG